MGLPVHLMEIVNRGNSVGLWDCKTVGSVAWLVFHWPVEGSPMQKYGIGVVIPTKEESPKPEMSPPPQYLAERLGLSSFLTCTNEHGCPMLDQGKTFSEASWF